MGNHIQGICGSLCDRVLNIQPKNEILLDTQIKEINKSQTQTIVQVPHFQNKKERIDSNYDDLSFLVIRGSNLIERQNTSKTNQLQSHLKSGNYIISTLKKVSKNQQKNEPILKNKS